MSKLTSNRTPSSMDPFEYGVQLALERLFLMWQREAVQCQLMMDESGRRIDEPYEREHHSYWRGRRDGFETAAHMLNELVLPQRRRWIRRAMRYLSRRR